MCLVDGGHKGKPTEQPNTTAEYQAYTYQRTDLGSVLTKEHVGFSLRREVYIYLFFSWMSCKTIGKVSKLETLS